MRRRTIKQSPFFANTTARDGNGWDNRPKYFKLNKKDDMREARKLYKTLEYLLTSSDKNYEKEKFRTGGGSGFYTRQQNCVLKMRYGPELAKHMRFLEEYLTQEKKNEVIVKPKLFSENEVDDEFIENYKNNMDSKHFKFIISPENPEVDCKVLTKTLVKRLEKITGYKFFWLAAVHTNTNHPHAHLLINGIDKNGKEVDCFRGTMLKHTIREMARQICTELKGERTEQEIEAAKRKLPEANRYCVLDKEIEQYCFISSSNNDTDYPVTVRSQNDVMYKRLCHLEKIGLAKREESEANIFNLEKNWSEKLHSAGRYSSYLTARNELLFTHGVDLKIFGNDNEVASGIITKLYKMNYEESWDNAVVIENRESKKAWFVPVYNEPNDKLLGAEVNCHRSDRGGKMRPVVHVEKWNVLGK